MSPNMSKRSPPPSFIYQSFHATFKAISHLFFREIKTSGLHHVPVEGPCIFIVGPHANQFVDGIVYMSVNPRPSYALMADVSYQRPLIGHVGKLLSAIPVVRPQDIVIPGAGTVTYDPLDPMRLFGQGTAFTTQLHARDFIIIAHNYKAHVKRVVSDTELYITHAIKVDPEIPLEEQTYRIAPHVDQTPVYEEVHRYLDNNECVTIFPEGGSHDRPDMLPLKAGFAVMALGAMENNPDLDLKIVPVGLNYFHPDRFRSRAVVSFGQPLSIDRQDVEKFRQGGRLRREAVTKLLDQSDEAFKTVTTSAPDYDTLMTIQAARRLYRSSSTTAKATIQHVVQMNRNFVLGWAKLKDDPKLQELTRKVKMYNDTLSFFGIRDHQVDKLDITTTHATFQLVRRLVLLLILAGLGTPALIANLPLVCIAKYISKRKQKAALAGSMVKIAAKDVIATWKIIVTSLVAPVQYGFYSFLYYLYLKQRRPTLSLGARVGRACASFVAQPIVNYLLMRLDDRRVDTCKSIKPLWLAIRNPEVSSIIKSMRQELSQDITAFVNQHASIILPDHVEDDTCLVDSKDDSDSQSLTPDDSLSCSMSIIDPPSLSQSTMSTQSNSTETAAIV